ncbi:sodium:alanine symporter family protein [Salinisphaera sp.]|uniref:alanine/glycine:cation symporter family protein n=1 Tax=Salinisphaera sp. TaxID=1914330 RepID=UPI000C44CCBF|nr:sodium:alanine symporter family protein [Salinisphaera sp.]MAS11620.1 sodium:alanine symporter family protein [Salinisphaera sp.]|tara:strand:- start:61 stop:1518 length:1458 start_codon:yes stop_codon:yes gene_type:complete
MELLDTLQQGIYAVMTPVSSFIWSYILFYLLFGAGIGFTIMTRFMQFRMLGHMVRITFDSRSSDQGVSSFQALATSLAARVGTGNLAGVALALWVGGPGAVFWMWMTALVGLATTFVECTLGQVYKIHYADGVYRGGPAYYIERALGQKWMSILFAVFLIIAYGFAFSGAQANTIAKGMEGAFDVPTWVTGIALVVLAAVVIYGGLRSIARVAEKIVPLMAIGYFLVAVYVMIANYSEVPGMLWLIIQSAFGFGPAVGGAVGYTIKVAMENGVKRGLFSNEAGMGSTPNAAATAEVNHPAAQGLVQAFGVVIDTLIICSCTAVVILLSGVYDQMLASGGGESMQGIQLTQTAMADHLGGFGVGFIAVAILFFAYTSILANFAYSEINLEYLAGKHHKKAIAILRPLVLAMVMIGSVATLGFVWDFADLAMGLMATTNLIAIIFLAPIALRVLKDYERQRGEGIDEPVFNRQVLKKPDEVEPGIWD